MNRPHQGRVARSHGHVSVQRRGLMPLVMTRGQDIFAPLEDPARPVWSPVRFRFTPRVTRLMQELKRSERCSSSIEIETHEQVSLRIATEHEDMVPKHTEPPVPVHGDRTLVSLPHAEPQEPE